MPLHTLFLAALLSAGSAAVLPTPAHAASFDCKQAKEADEKAVCGDRALEDRDVELATRFEMIMPLVGMGTRGDLGDGQKQWLAKRHACGADQACLVSAYDGRIAELKTAFKVIVARGPF